MLLLKRAFAKLLEGSKVDFMSSLRVLDEGDKKGERTKLASKLSGYSNAKEFIGREKIHSKDLVRQGTQKDVEMTFAGGSPNIEKRSTIAAFRWHRNSKPPPR